MDANTFLDGCILVSTAPEEKYMVEPNGRKVWEERRMRKERGHEERDAKEEKRGKR